MKYHIDYSGKFKKDLKRCHKRHMDVELLRQVIKSLENTGTVPVEHRPHKLSGDYAVAGSVIFRVTGYLCGNKMMRN